MAAAGFLTACGCVLVPWCVCLKMARSIYHFAFETPLRSDVLLGELSRPRGVPELPPAPRPGGPVAAASSCPSWVVVSLRLCSLCLLSIQWQWASGSFLTSFPFGELGKCRPSPCALVQGRFQGAELEADCATWLCFSSGVSRAQ